MSIIYELAEQAAEHAVLNPSDEILQSETEDSKVEVPKAFIDKFAELVVQNFCQKLEDDGMVEIAIEMKQHFGIE